MANNKDFKRNLRAFYHRMLDRASEFYYTGKPKMSDATFDLLAKRSGYKGIGYKVKAESQKAKKAGRIKEALPVQLGSLKKVKSLQELPKRFKTQKLVASVKLDGLHVLVQMGDAPKGGQHLVKAWTRGGGEEGLVITKQMALAFGKYYGSLDSLVQCPANLLVSGEAIMPTTHWEKHLKNRFDNARSAVAALLSASFNEADAKHYEAIEFYAHKVHSYKGSKQEKLLKRNEFSKLAAANFKVPPYIVCTLEKYPSLEHVILKEAQEKHLTCDGVVIDLDDAEGLIFDGKYPQWAYAYKPYIEKPLRTKVKEVQWNLSRHGEYVPLVKFDSVVIDGVTISQATGHSASNIKELGIDAGAVVGVIRSGSVIPYIKEVYKEAESVTLPPGEWQGARLFSTESAQNKQLYFALTTFKVEGISEDSCKALLTLTEKFSSESHPLLALKEAMTQPKFNKAVKEHFGKVRGGNLMESLENLNKPVEEEKLAAASGLFGRGFGVKKAKQLLSGTYPDTDAFRHWNRCLKKFDAFKRRFAVKGSEKKSDVLKDISFVFTGFRNETYEGIIEANGGKVTSSPNAKSIVIYKDTSSSKYKAGKEKGAYLLKAEEFPAFMAKAYKIVI